MTDLFPQMRDELNRVAGQRARRSRLRRRLPATVALTMMTGVAGFLALGASSGGIDVVAEARAALAGPEEIIHYVGTVTVAGNEPEQIKQWATVEPTRWHVVRATGEAAYRDGEMTTYNASRGSLHTLRGLADNPPAPPGFGPLGSDAVTTIKRMLAAEQLQDIGQATVDGCTVRRLRGRTPGIGPNAPLEVTYDVDPESYEPVAARAEPGRGAPAVDIRFETFERLPFTPTTEHLLEVQPATPPTSVTGNG